jgi:hypothetical protein
MFISGRGKDDYLTGVATSPKIKDPAFKSWKAENNMVMSWLINSMHPEIGETFLLYPTAAEIWQAAREIFSNSEDMSELFETENTLHDLRQGEMSVLQLAHASMAKDRHLRTSPVDLLRRLKSLPQDSGDQTCV